MFRMRFVIYCLKQRTEESEKTMTNKELLEKMKKNRDQFINEYEKYSLSIDERLPYLDMIIKLNQEIRTLQSLFDEI